MRLLISIYILFFSNVVLASTLDITSIKARISPDIQKKSISAQLVITAKILKNTKNIYFPIEDLISIQASNSKNNITWQVKNKKIIISREKLFQKNELITINIVYKGKVSGIDFNQGNIYSNYDSCKWLLCSDIPGDKFLIHIDLKAAKNQTTTASGNYLGSYNGWQKWATKREIPGYLVGFYIGTMNTSRFKHRKRELILIHDNINTIQKNKIFTKTIDALSFFESKSGFKLPVNKYTQVVVPGYMAQEKSSLALLGWEFLQPMFSNKQEDWLIVHELAHQWWGNSIICKSWSHFWLNEGITSFMVASYKEFAWGRQAYIQEMDLAQKRYNIAIKANFDVPLSFSGKYPSLKIKRAIAYSKGALFMDALRRNLGEVKFWSAFKDYSSKFQGQLVTSKDLQESFEKSTKTSLQKIFNKWVY